MYKTLDVAMYYVGTLLNTEDTETLIIDFLFKKNILRDFDITRTLSNYFTFKINYFVVQIILSV